MARVRAAIALHCCELLWIGSYMTFLCLDREIIRCLSGAGPMPDVKVAAMLNVPDSTILHRLSRLIDDGVGSCVTLTDPWKVGYRLSVMTSLEVELGVIQRLSHSVHEFLGIYFVMVTTGQFTIIPSSAFVSNNDPFPRPENRLSPASMPSLPLTPLRSCIDFARSGPLLMREAARPSTTLADSAHTTAPS